MQIRLRNPPFSGEARSRGPLQGPGRRSLTDEAARDHFGRKTRAAQSVRHFFYREFAFWSETCKKIRKKGLKLKK